MTTANKLSALRKTTLIASTCAFIIAVFAAIYLYILYFTPAPYNAGHPMLIAHAGGQIDGHTYTNSIEALESSIQKGYRHIELDLLETLDGHIVAAHDWKHYHEITGGSGDTPLTIHEFAQRKIHGKYTPITYKDINSYFTKHNLVLVTDKIENYDLLLKEINLPRERLLVETFSHKQYRKALGKGVKYPMLCLWDKASLDEHSQRLWGGSVAMLTVPVNIILEAEKELAAQTSKGVGVFAFTSNDVDFVERHMGATVTGFYTDFITPNDISIQK